MNRLKWLDWANVLAMVAVVWFHIPSAVEKPFNGIEYITVIIPFFFMAGFAYALSRRQSLPLLELGRRIGRTLLIPTCAFYVLFYLLWLVMGRTLAGDTEPWYEPLIQFVTGDFSTVLATYWFIIALMVMYLFSHTLQRIPSRWIYASCCGLFPLLTLLFPVGNTWQLYNVLVFIPFFALGDLYGQYSLYQRSPRPMLAIGAGLLTYIVVVQEWSLDASYHSCDVLCGFVLLGIICLISHGVSGRREHAFISILRSGALIILATQNYIIGILRVVMDRFSGSEDYLANHFVQKPLVLLLVYLVTLPLILFTLRYMPWLAGRRRESLLYREK